MFDPLDGSRNLDVAIPTGTIFGFYDGAEAPQGVAGAAADDADDNDGGGGPLDALALQPGSRLVAAGYALYSSATVLALTVGGGRLAMFHLDPSSSPSSGGGGGGGGEWVLVDGDVRIPRRGQIYSLNDARQFDWPAGLRRYVDAVRRGEGETGKQYSARYVCSLVADLHRTILQGGWCGNPRPHLRLVYEGNPLAMVVEQAGGRASDGARRVLGIEPEALHQRLPLFMGSEDDVAELESYGDVQQGAGKTYAV